MAAPPPAFPESRLRRHPPWPHPAWKTKLKNSSPWGKCKKGQPAGPAAGIPAQRRSGQGAGLGGLPLPLPGISAAAGEPEAEAPGAAGVGRGRLLWQVRGRRGVAAGGPRRVPAEGWASWRKCGPGGALRLRWWRRVLSRAPAPVPVRPRAGDAVGPPGARRSGGSPGRSGSRWDSEFLVSHAPNGLSSESWVSKQTCKKSGNCVNNRHPISAAVGNAVIKTLNVLKFKVENAEIS